MKGVIMKTKADEFSQDLVVISLIYILIFTFGYLLSNHYQLEKQKVETMKAQKIAVELYEEKMLVEESLDRALEGLDSLNSELDKYEKATDKVNLIVKELVSLESKTETMSVLVLFSESSGNKNAKHSKKNVQGWCGVDVSIWGEELKQNDIEVNSLKACDYILNKYLEENNWNKKLALYGYKGVEKNIKVKGIIENMIKIEKKIDKELK